MRFIAVLVAVGLPILVIVKSSIAQTDIESASKAARNPERKYPVFDSRTRAHSGDPQFFWINNDELLFLAVRVLADGGSPNKERINYVVNRWSIRRGAVSEVRDFGADRPKVCYYDGQVLYQVRRSDDSLIAYHGKIGEQERVVDPREYHGSFCRHLKEIPVIPQWMKDREARRLERLNDGFVDFGETKRWIENSPVRLYRYGQEQEAGKQLPFGRREISHRFPYYEFKDAYFVVSQYWLHPRPKEIPYPVFWMYRDGRVEKIADIPWGPWRSSASFRPFPTRAGIVMASSNFNVRDNTDLAHAGLYLLTSEGRLAKVLSAWVDGLDVSVSPDGCMIAFTYARVVTRKNNVLQAMNLCTGG